MIAGLAGSGIGRRGEVPGHRGCQFLCRQPVGSAWRTEAALGRGIRRSALAPAAPAACRGADAVSAADPDRGDQPLRYRPRTVVARDCGGVPVGAARTASRCMAPACIRFWTASTGRTARIGTTAASGTCRGTVQGITAESDNEHLRQSIARRANCSYRVSPGAAPAIRTVAGQVHSSGAHSPTKLLGAGTSPFDANRKRKDYREPQYYYVFPPPLRFPATSAPNICFRVWPKCTGSFYRGAGVRR